MSAPIQKPFAAKHPVLDVGADECQGLTGQLIYQWQAPGSARFYCTHTHHIHHHTHTDHTHTPYMKQQHAYTTHIQMDK